MGYQDFGIGDTLSEDPLIQYDEIPRFPPECFAHLHNPSTAKFKNSSASGPPASFCRRGRSRSFIMSNSVVKTPLLAAVGPLQFEVVQYRLENEYGAASRLEAAPWTLARWLPPGMGEASMEALKLPTGARRAFDNADRPVILFPNDWTAAYFAQTNPDIALTNLPPKLTRLRIEESVPRRRPRDRIHHNRAAARAAPAKAAAPTAGGAGRARPAPLGKLVTYYLVTGIDYTLDQKEGRHQGFVLVNRPQILLDPLE